MEALSRREEQEIEASAKSEALHKCDPFVKGELGVHVEQATRRKCDGGQSLIPDFAECAAGRTFTTPFACATQFKAMNACTKRE
jgi:hypothetical protein